MKVVLGGFGVGFSWAAAALTVGPIVVPALAMVDGSMGGGQHDQPS
jgi:hypothetical protein